MIAVAGGFVGSVLLLYIRWGRENRQEDRRRLGMVLVLQFELEQAKLRLESAIRRTSLTGLSNFSTGAWQQYGAAVVTVLDREAAQDVAAAFRRIQMMEPNLEAARDQGRKPSPKNLRVFRQAVKEISAAIDRLQEAERRMGGRRRIPTLRRRRRPT